MQYSLYFKKIRIYICYIVGVFKKDKYSLLYMKM